MKLFTNIDILSPSPSILINGKTRSQSPLGGLLTLVLVILSLMGFGYFTSSALSRTQPMAYNNKQFKNNTVKQVNTSESPFIFRLIDSKSQPFENEESLFQIAVANTKTEYIMKDGRQTNNMTHYPMKTMRCGKDYKLDSQEFRDVWSNFDFSNYWCLSPNQIVEFKNPR
jgi:hypothetical protein